MGQELSQSPGLSPAEEPARMMSEVDLRVDLKMDSVSVAESSLRKASERTKALRELRFMTFGYRSEDELGSLLLCSSNADGILTAVEILSEEVFALPDVTVAAMSVHGPSEELEKLKEHLAPNSLTMHPHQYLGEWRVPVSSTANPYNLVQITAADEISSPVPSLELLTILQKCVHTSRCKEGPRNNVRYGFDFAPNEEGGLVMAVRETYKTGDALALHFDACGPLFGSLFELDEVSLKHVEIHGPAAELDKVRVLTDPLGAKYFITLESVGFQRV